VQSQTPSDPYYQYQFYLDMLNVQDAWDITKGDSTIKIAVLDQEFTFHEDLPASKNPLSIGANAPYLPNSGGPVLNCSEHDFVVDLILAVS